MNKSLKRLRKEAAKTQVVEARSRAGLGGSPEGYLSYNTYHEIVVSAYKDLLRRFPRAKLSRGGDYDAWVRLAFTDVYGGNRALTEFTKSADFGMLLNEFMWRERGSTVLFPQTPELVENIMNAKYKVSPEVFEPVGRGSFIVSTPKGFAPLGTQLPPFLLSFHDWEYSQGACIRTFKRWLGIDLTAVEPEGQDIGEPCISIAYHTGEGEDSAHITFRMPLANPAEALMQDDYLIRSHKDFFTSSAPGSSEPSMYNYAEIATMLKIGFGICVYAKVFPGALVPGFPEAPDVSGENKLLLRAPKITVQQSTVSGITRSPHFRNWSFHTLTHKRFERGGVVPRVIFVKPSWVNADIDPVTVVRI